jgi:hypothetical protein
LAEGLLARIWLRENIVHKIVDWYFLSKGQELNNLSNGSEKFFTVSGSSVRSKNAKW